MNYLICALIALLGVSAAFNACQMDKMDALTENLAVAEEVNQRNAEAIHQLERSRNATDRVLAGWNEDRNALAQVRAGGRKEIKEAMRDENLKTWADAPVPAAAWRMFGGAIDQNGNNSASASGGAALPLPGNGNSKQRH